MATEYNRQYVGARYVPQFFNNPDGSWDWAQGFQYEPLTMVKYGENTYTSKGLVPGTVGNPNLNPQYWALTGNYNGAIMQLNNEINQLIKSKNFTTPESFGAYGDGIHDDTDAVQQAINTGNALLTKSYLITSQYTYTIVGKQATINYCLNVPDGTAILVTGEIISNNCVIFKMGNDCKLIGGKYTFNTINNSIILYGKEIVLCDQVKNVILKDIISNDAILCAVASNNITVTDCTFIKNNNSVTNAIIGMHVVTNGKIDKISCYGYGGDGTILAFTSNNITITNCYLVADSYPQDIDLGAQGICVDTACEDIIVSQNKGSSFYHFIDIKSGAKNIIICNNTSIKNKCGITVRLGEQTGGELNTNNNITVNDNIIDMGWNKETSPIPGSANIYSQTLTACGIYLTNGNNINVLNNLIFTSIDVTGIGIFAWKMTGNVCIQANKIHVKNDISNSFLSGVFIAINNEVSYNAYLLGNIFLTYDLNEEIIVPFFLKNLYEIEFKNNIIISGKLPPHIENVNMVIMDSNTIKENVNYYLTNLQNVILLSNLIESNDAFMFTNLNLESGVSESNILKGGINFSGTGCKTNNDVIIKN